MNMECETWIKVYITKQQFDIILSKYELVRQTLIYYLKDGVRISNNKVQRKVCIKYKKILLYLKLYNKLIPVTRSVNEELKTSIESFEYESIICRYILEEDTTFRFALEEIFKDNEVWFAITSELEYDDVKFASISKKEDEFLNRISKYEWIWQNIEIDKMTYKVIDLLSTPSRRFLSIRDHFNKCIQHVKCKLKYNGYRGKICYNGSVLLYVDDLNNIETAECKELIDKQFENVAFQIEICKDINSIIITDVLCCTVNNKRHTMDPLNVLCYFDCIRNLFDNATITVAGSKFKLILQSEQKNAVLSNFSYKHNCIDGLLLISEYNEYKLKYPTIDCIYKKARNALYTRDDVSVDVDLNKHPNINYVDEGIYEVEIRYINYIDTNQDVNHTNIINIPYDNTDNINYEYSIIRYRIDRSYANSNEEVKDAIKDSFYIYKLHEYFKSALLVKCNTGVSNMKL